jgi:hypothetical protein
MTSFFFRFFREKNLRVTRVTIPYLGNNPGRGGCDGRCERLPLVELGELKLDALLPWKQAVFNASAVLYHRRGHIQGGGEGLLPWKQRRRAIAETMR